jgi:hypothetical protein
MPEAAVWIDMWILLKSEIVAQNGLGRELLAQCDALDAGTIELFANLQTEYNQSQKPKEKPKQGKEAFRGLG